MTGNDIEQSRNAEWQDFRTQLSYTAGASLAVTLTLTLGLSGGSCPRQHPGTQVLVSLF